MLNRIAAKTGARTYLEIGVAAGETFAEVSVPLKHAVDPNFLFDHRSRETEKARYFPLTSDAFFESQDALARYDLMFVDGLHTFDQTLIDLINCLNRATPTSVIVVDDVMPVDIWSSLANQELAYSFRRQYGAAMHYAWHGDVYKIPFFVAHYLPAFEYRTMNDQDNFRTVLWRGPRARRPAGPRPNLEQISRLGFVDIKAAEETYQFAGLSDILALLPAAQAGNADL
jgi:hypothetical protein